MDGLEVWGGHECTVNRIGEAFRDQTRLTGHHDRIDDLDAFAALGVKRLRYPVLWERAAPRNPHEPDFAWSDLRLGRLAELNIEPIVGLLHHGSGPAYTDLLDPAFASGLAAFAAQVARRYPHVADWTPVNEPLTTARFSCLYGHWYPHLADEASFWLALLNQIDGVRLAMREIRRITPSARLIQTEDFGRTYATAPALYQAHYDNTRRWMTWDLLCGRVGPDHAMWDRLCGFGLRDRLAAIADDPCPPDVFGLNHYLTSERFLDHRCEAYRGVLCGGNGELAYVDVEAVRVMSPPPLGLEGALREVWARYGKTLAVTECHNGCTREEQMRWLAEAWDTAGRLRNEGLPIAAVTAWSLLGAYDWDSLLTQSQNAYEPGVFDLRSSGPPRATATAGLLQALSTGCERPLAAQGSGWWRRDIRLEHRPAAASGPVDPGSAWRAPPRASRPLLITGATGTLGRAFARACQHRGLDYQVTTRAMLDLGDEGAVDAALAHYRPWAVVNAAGWVRVDEAERDAAGCMAANAEGVERLVRACRRHGAAFVGFSSDLVFDGMAGRPYKETDEPAPLNVYGASKRDAERLALQAGESLMIRTAAFFSPDDPYNFAVQTLAALMAGEEVKAADDLVISPTYVPDLVRNTLDLVIDEARGIWHLANQGEISWAGFACMLAQSAGLDESLVRGVPATELGWPAPRPRYAALGTERGALMPSLGSAIARFTARLAEVQGPGSTGRVRRAA